MLRLIKSVLKASCLFVKGYVRKGKLLNMLLPFIMILCLAGGFMLDRIYFTPQEDIPSLSEMEMFDKDLVESYIGVSVNYQPSISKDARFITFSAIKLEVNKVKDMEIKLYDKDTKKYVELPGINSKGWDLAPSISEDGRWIAFQSNRNGATRWDIFLYDVKAKKLVPLSGLNSVLPDFNPAISPEGRYITFNSMRSLIPKLYLYDIQAHKVVPLEEEVNQ